MAEHEIIYLVLFGVCLILSAFFSSSETAIFSLQKVRLQYLVEQQVAGAGSIAKMIEQPSKLLSTILLGNNLVNVATAAIATTLAIKYLPENQGVLIATICTTILLLVFSETIPKTIAAYHSEKISLIYARPLKIISWLLYPFVIVLNWIVSLFTRLFGFGNSTGSLFSVEEIHTMISIGRQEGEVEEPEAKILHKVFDFRYRLAREVMIPRSEVIAIEIGSTVAEFLNLFVEIPRSRFPVYRDNMDGVIGIIVAKDVFIGLKKGYLHEQNLIDDLVRPAYACCIIKRDGIANKIPRSCNKEFPGIAEY
ncbi:MAG: HlyC/CorC family transporter, partial [Dehalococcoidales bacterium]|nr:HlyC/CorC family transporter [Dehalococcoidales bacterium]